jgi:large subunit ribosomal protein L5
MTDTMTAPTNVVPRLKVQYNTEIRDALREQLEKPNIMQVPRLDKIVVNMGVGEAVACASLLEGNAIGAKVTLRGDRMYEFLDRLIGLAIPRIRDFRGLPTKSFDGHGNYTFGVTEQLIFPEIDYDKIDTTRGMDITIVTTATSDEDGRALLDAFSFPFKVEGQ